MKAALLQITSSDDPEANAAMVRGMAQEAIDRGAELICTPEVTNCVSLSRRRQVEVLSNEDSDPVVAALREVALAGRVHVALGSVALKLDGQDRFANRSLLIGPDGGIIARYDKIHMFDVAVSEEETYRESRGYRPGTRAVLAETPLARFGMTICYDIRFPALYRALARSGAEVLLVPSAFSPVTGAAHWEPLLRARAIENGAFVLAAAQTGTHPLTGSGTARTTHGHSLAVSPWGEVLCNMGTETGIALVDLDLDRVADIRKRIPSLSGDRAFDGP